jgi:hypothetical protein
MAYTQRATRTTDGNSKAEQLFRSVDFREFEFLYTFTPKNRQEAANVLKIIRTFRHHMLPEFRDENNFMYIYPSEFNVKYYHGSAENIYIEKQLTAVLQSCDVDYTPNGQFVSFGPGDGAPGGMPQQITMSLRFKELSVATKESSPSDAQGV